MKQTALVLGGGGFIGSHMVKKLKSEGYWVRSVDLKYPEYSSSPADEFLIGDLRNPSFVSKVMFNDGVRDNYQTSPDDKENSFDEVYQFAADMGGAGYVFSKVHDADILHNSALINLNVAHYAVMFKIKKLFFSSSACVYPEQLQQSDDPYSLKESDAYPVNPDSNYGYEKIFSERVYAAYSTNYGLHVKIARFHNIFGPEGTYKGGKEKAPAALCRKVAEANDGDTIEIWGNGEQTRSFLYIDYCIQAVRDLMNSDLNVPVNIGSDYSISINDLLKMVMEISGKNTLFVKHIDGPIGVRGRSSNNDKFYDACGYTPNIELRKNIEIVYKWIQSQLTKSITF